MNSGQPTAAHGAMKPFRRFRDVAYLGYGIGPAMARGAVGSFALHIVSTVISLATAVLLARLLGASGYGVYSLAMVYANLLGLVACLGFPQLIVRHVARLSASESWNAMAELMRTSLFVTLASALVLSGAVILVLPHMMGGDTAIDRGAVLLVLLLILPIALQRLGESSLLGLDHPVQGLVPERVVRPVLLLILVAGLAWTMSTPLAPQNALAAHLAAYGVSLAAVIWLVMRRSPAPWWRFPATLAPEHVREAFPLLAAGLMTLLSTRLDIIMLGWLSEPEDVGQYRLASQLASLPLMIAATAQAVASPSISRYFSEQRLHELKPTLLKLAAGTGLATLAISALVLPVSRLLLPHLGSSFAEAESVLLILMLAYALVAVLFFALPLLTMTGHAGSVAIANGAAILVNVVLNVLLIPRYGAEGTAAATLVSFAVLYGLHIWNVRRLLGIRIW